MQPSNTHNIKLGIIVILTALATVNVSAEPPTRSVESTKQASRDHEKLLILINELNEQRNLASQLAQKKALALNNNNKTELADTEERLIEIADNINQLDQEIALAQGRQVVSLQVETPTVKMTRSQGSTPERTISSQTEQEKPDGLAGEWWDFYRRKN